MDRALYISMTGAKHNMLAQTNHSNNLANANTHGFRADFAQARSMPIYGGDGLPTRAYALTENSGTDFRQGSLDTTGRELDIAIQGDGFIAVQAADGTEAYTRAGNFQVDSQGFLKTGNGLPVLGSGGPISIPQNEKIDISEDGIITIVVAGQGPDALAEIDRIKLVNPDMAQLDKYEDGLIRLKEGGESEPAPEVRVISGFLESSNVNVVEEFTNILSLSRQYEMQVKMMSTVDENSQTSARLLQMT